MESNAKLDKKTMIKSSAFVTAELFDAVDISAIVNTILGA